MEKNNLHENFKSDIEYWSSMWDDMQDQGIHPEPESVKPSEEESDDPFYNSIDYEAEKIELLQEESQCNASGLENIKEENPLHPDSAGPDYMTTPPVWLDNKLIDEVQELKDKLFKLENDLADHMGGGKKWLEKSHEPNNKKIMGQIESLKNKIEKVSSKIGLEKGTADANSRRDHLGFNN